ncbi:hypothetical protein [Salinarimonas ramus]|uniref:Uncharacterized protein n=1 Tax=Salinarimonas ramus TaxID=690164 RepID=A0A917QGB1_9HYPH|nr:hypothetical protein [Salinarimonas ramus]GGK49051.1 hypothetical protein GCM10011322_40060 [Salinarimonas ramus]
MTRHNRIRARRLALMAGVGVTALAMGEIGFEPTRIALPAGEGTIAVEAVRLEGGLFSAAFAQSAVTLENVTINAGPSVYRLPSVTFEGSSLSRDALEAALRGKTDGSWQETLAEISAERIVAPQLVIEQTVDEGTSTITYSDVVAENVVEGMIARLVAASATIEAEGPDGRPFEGSVGEMFVEGLDLPFTASWYAEAAPDGAENPFRTFYERFSVADMSFGDEEATVAIARISGEEVEGRLMETPFTEMMPELEAMSDVEEPSDEDARRMLGMMADMLGAVRFGPMVVEDVAVTAAEMGDEPVFRIARIGVGGDEPARIEGLSIDVDEGEMTIASMSSEGFSLEPMLAGMRRMAQTPDLEMDAATARALMPTIGTVRLEGLDANIVPEGETTPMMFSLASFAMTADEPINGAPTNIRVSFDNLAFALPSASEEQAVVQLRTLGYEDLDLSGVFAARWNAEAEEVTIEEASISGVEMGSVRLTGAFGNIGEAAFATDQMAMMMAWLGATAKNVSVNVVDEGLAERVLEMQASAQGVSAEDLRGQGAMMARAMLPAMLGGTPEARALGDAIAAFVETPGELDVVVTAKEPTGIPVMQLGQTENPMDLLPLVSIEAQAR